MKRNLEVEVIIQNIFTGSTTTMTFETIEAVEKYVREHSEVIARGKSIKYKRCCKADRLPS